MLVTTANDLAGYRIVQHLGIVRGITVRSRSVVGNFIGMISAFFGGRIGRVSPRPGLNSPLANSGSRPWIRSASPRARSRRPAVP